ncbi:MAG: NAD-dependent epimerase/dehydratase family protein [Aquihabitans sp.]
MTRTAAPITVVAGAGGFIGGHLVAALLNDGARVRAVDVKPVTEWYQPHRESDQLVLDLKEKAHAERAVDGADTVYNLACDMGGMGFIERNRARCMLSVLINTHLLEASRAADVDRYFYASSACVYPANLQDRPDVVALKEDDVHPAMPEEGYGWEKLFGEKLCRYYYDDHGMTTRVARLHNVYGPHGTFGGGREKAPAAICRKVAEASLSGRHVIDVWGDGHQTRTFTYIDDAIVGIRTLTASAMTNPLNIGSSEVVSINDLIDIVSVIAGIEVERRHDLSQPQGVRGRSSDNTLIRELFDWEPSTPLRTGLEATYAWIHDQLTQ